MNIEEIMKPYFDKKEEIERKNEVNNKYIEERNIINLRLERLRENKDREIEEYIQNAIQDRPDFYSGYGAMIRKDLEQAYAQKEQQLENELKEIEEKIKNNSNELARYHRVDIREIVDVKHDLRKTLISTKKELEIKVREVQLQFDTVMLELSTFKYEYDENHNVVNGFEYRNLFEESNRLIEVKYNLQRDLKQIDEYLKLTELTEEEVKTLMMSMTDLEKEEYNRRKVSKAFEPITIKFIEELKEQYPELVDVYNERFRKIIAFNPELKNKILELSLSQTNFIERLENLFVEYPNLKDVMSEFLIEYYKRNGVEEKNLSNVQNTSEEVKDGVVDSTEGKVDSIISTVEQLVEEEFAPQTEETNNNENQVDNSAAQQSVTDYAKEAIITQRKLKDNYSEFIKEVSTDILLSVNKLRAVKITDGKYLSYSTPDQETENYELEDASAQLLNGLYLNKRDVFNALNNYVKKNKGETFVVKGMNQTLTVTKKSLKAVKKFLKECTVKKLFNEKKLSAFDIKRVFGKDKAEKYTKDAEGTVKTRKVPVGDYILRSDIHEAIKQLFVEKTPTWFESLKSKFTTQNDEIMVDAALDADYDLVELEKLEKPATKVK